jgi:integrase
VTAVPGYGRRLRPNPNPVAGPAIGQDAGPERGIARRDAQPGRDHGDDRAERGRVHVGRQDGTHVAPPGRGLSKRHERYHRSGHVRRPIGDPFATAGFAKLIERAGGAAGFAFKAHPHMLRHACGFALANAGHDTRALQAYLGHRNIQHTVRYTELAPDRFKDFWR